MRQLTVTRHRPEPNRDPRNRCPQKKPDCSMNHFYEVPAIDVRGTWNLLDMLDHNSLENLYIAYKAVKG